MPKSQKDIVPIAILQLELESESGMVHVFRAFKMMGWGNRIRVLGFLALFGLILASCLFARWYLFSTGTLISNALG